MHWKQYSDGLCVVGLGGGISPSYPSRSAPVTRTPGRLTTLQNSQRLFVSPAPSRAAPSHHTKSAANPGGLPEIAPDLPHHHPQAGIDIGVQGRAKAIHPNITSPRESTGARPASGDDAGQSRVKLSSSPSSEKTDSTESKFFHPVLHRTQPMHAQRCRSSASSSVASSLGELSVTSISLSSRTNGPSQQARSNSLESGSSLRDSESDYLSEIIGEYVSSPSPSAGQEATPRGTPRRVSSSYHSKLLRMRSLLKDNGHPTDALTTQTVDLEKGNCQTFKKLLVLTQIPNTSRSQRSRSTGDSAVATSVSSGSSSSDNTNRDRSMLVGLHQLSRQHRRNNSQGAVNRIDSESSTANPELPSLQSSSSASEERPVNTLVDQWLGGCQVVGNRLETESTRRRIEFSVPSIEEETESLNMN